MIGIGYSGEIPEEYLTVYNALDMAFQTLTAELEVYVPVPLVGDGVDETALAELMAILDATQIRDLDMFQIADVTKDDTFSLVIPLLLPMQLPGQHRIRLPMQRKALSIWKGRPFLSFLLI